MSKVTHVNVVLSEKENQVLTESARKHGRNKREEAQVRLVDHLMRFDEAGFVPKKVRE